MSPKDQAGGGIGEAEVRPAGGPTWPALLGLLLVTLVWGSTFVVVKDAIRVVPALQFLTLRFALGAVVMGLVALILALRSRGQGSQVPSPRLPSAMVGPGLLTGIVLGAGYVLQTVGLNFTSASDAGLLTGLFVVFTPLGLWAMTRRRPGAVTGAAVLACLVGLALLAGHVGGAALFGDALEVGCAAAFAVHILLLSRYSPRFPTAAFTAVQLGVAAAAFTVGAGFQPINWQAVRTQLPALLLTGVVASAGGFAIQTWAQRQLSPVRTALALATEPAFAVAAAFALAGERYGPVQWIGAATILAALLGHEWFSSRARSPDPG